MAKHKLRGDLETFVCSLFAQEKSGSEIRKMLQDIHGVKVSLPTIQKLSKERESEIEHIRTNMFKDSLKRNIPIASESVRLEREEALYQLSQNLRIKTQKITYGLQCLREAREETKAKEAPAAVSTNIQFNQFNQLTDAELIEKKKRLEKKIFDTAGSGANR